MTLLAIDVDYDGHITNATDYPKSDTGTTLLVGDNGKSGDGHIFLRFPLTDLPLGATITLVQLKIYCSEAGGGAHLLDVHPYNADGQADPEVDTGEACWNRCAAGSPYVDDDTCLRTTGPKTLTLGGSVATHIGAAKNAVNRFSLGLHEEGENDDKAEIYALENESNYAILEITYTAGGQTYEINVEAVVKASAEKSLQTTFNVRKDAAVTSQAVEGAETTFNISKDAMAKALTTLSFELGIPVEAVVKASAVPNLESTFNVSKEAIIEVLTTEILETTYNLRKDAVVAGSAAHGEETTFNISKDAVVQALANVIIEKISAQIIEIFKDAVVEAQATFSLESVFSINKDAIVKASAMVSPETVFNVVKDAIIKASASPQVVGVYPINVDAVVKASATAELQQTLGISKDAVVVAVSTPLIQSTFNIRPEAVVKVLAEVIVTKEKVEVIKLFLVLSLEHDALLLSLQPHGDINLNLEHSALALALSQATINLSLETPYIIELEVK